MWPSVVDDGGFRERKIKNDDMLDIVVDWTKPLTSMHYKHKKWLNEETSRFTDFHAKLLRVE